VHDTECERHVRSEPHADARAEYRCASDEEERVGSTDYGE
jgi:hypothetical protein